MPNNHEMTLTNDQRNVLLSAGAPQERLDEGVLLSSEEQLLEWLAQAQAFMAARYPGESFTYTGVDNTSPRRDSCLLHVVNDAAPEEPFTVKVTKDGNSESYYAILKREEMLEIVRGAFAEAGVEAGLEMEIISLYGEGYDPQQPLKQTLAGGRTLSVSGRAYVQTDDLSALQQHLEQTLRAAGLCGGISLRVVQGATIGEVLNRTGSDKAFVAKTVFVSLPDETSEVK